ncbi:MAG: hypothetical protein V3V08_19885 [Nannocystaceae bacterium]
MRFVVTGEWDRNTMLRLVLVLFLVYVLLFIVSSALLYFDRMGLDPASVQIYFLGDPDLDFGRPPRSYASMIETSHTHLFAMGMLVMVLTHLLLFAPMSPRSKAWLVILSFLSTLSSELCNWLVRFVSPSFAYAKIGSFIAMELSLLALTCAIAIHVYRPHRNAYKDGVR